MTGPKSVRELWNKPKAAKMGAKERDYINFFLVITFVLKVVERKYDYTNYSGFRIYILNKVSLSI